MLRISSSGPASQIGPSFLFSIPGAEEAVDDKQQQKQQQQQLQLTMKPVTSRRGSKVERETKSCFFNYYFGKWKVKLKSERTLCKFKMPSLLLWKDLPQDQSQFSQNGGQEETTTLENVERIHLGTKRSCDADAESSLNPP